MSSCDLEVAAKLQQCVVAFLRWEVRPRIVRSYVMNNNHRLMRSKSLFVIVIEIADTFANKLIKRRAKRR